MSPLAAKLMGQWMNKKRLAREKKEFCKYGHRLAGRNVRFFTNEGYRNRRCVKCEREKRKKQEGKIEFNNAYLNRVMRDFKKAEGAYGV